MINKVILHKNKTKQQWYDLKINTLKLLTLLKQLGLAPFSNNLITSDTSFSLTAVIKGSSYIINISLIY